MASGLICPSGLGPREGAGLPKVTQPRGTEAADARFPTQCAPARQGLPGVPELTWLIPRPRGASPRQGPPPAGPAERPRPSHSDGPAAVAASPVSAPPPWNSDPAWRGRVGPRALKGALQFPSWQGGLEEELESPDWGRAWPGPPAWASPEPQAILPPQMSQPHPG